MRIILLTAVQMISGIGKHFANKTLGFAPGTNLSSYTQLYIAFLISGLIHAGGDFMVVRYLPIFPLKFFLLQAVAITIEDFVIWCTRSIRPKLGWLNKAIGFAWVVVWFTWSGPQWLDPMSANGGTVDGEGVVFKPLLNFFRAS